MNYICGLWRPYSTQYITGVGDSVKVVEDNLRRTDIEDVLKGVDKAYLRRTDIGDALKGMDEATQEEAQIADAEVQNVEHNVDNEGAESKIRCSVSTTMKLASTMTSMTCRRTSMTRPRSLIALYRSMMATTTITQCAR